eukprot:CAMPEP_0175889916 /NCGR_PEP_ID=MMETSP0107_2-20121207/47532_1 /TAXON_ID=195067 ORGANISM="Goniomonas pacifica, Strain CCMP1869" /NCGR_SAMPLE_ID=MMETSP0107_2 /ASSEMBLY_ACC=CAM_ASM_000203 /LENGTH=114 /DNA_ID=CAMNT_0017210611 /DNA_START=294 /DNA_END=638 /DNA_ORIENTATION=+
MEEATVGKVQHRARPSGAKVMQKPLVSASSSMHYLRACKTRCLSFHRCCNKYLIDAAVASSGAYKLEPAHSVQQFATCLALRQGGSKPRHAEADETYQAERDKRDSVRVDSPTT